MMRVKLHLYPDSKSWIAGVKDINPEDLIDFDYNESWARYDRYYVNKADLIGQPTKTKKRGKKV